MNEEMTYRDHLYKQKDKMKPDEYQYAIECAKGMLYPPSLEMKSPRLNKSAKVNNWKKQAQITYRLRLEKMA